MRDSESALRSIPQALQYLPEVVGGAERLSTLAERESMVMTAEQRLGEELDDREERLVKSAGSDELLVAAAVALDASFGDGSSLPERWRIITRAEQWHEEDRAEDAERSVPLDDLEAMLKETSSGAQYLAAAQQEVLGEGKEPATLDERDSVVTTAWRRVKQELDGREQALAARRCEDGSVEVGGAWLYAIKLIELEAGQQQNDGPSPGCREQALAWAAQQMDRLDALRQEEALDLFFGKLFELEPARGPADIAEEAERRAAAARRQDRVDALSEDELVFVEEKRAALDPQGREVGPWKPAHVAAAVDYAHARVEALDEEIERLRTIIEQTPGDGYARLLAAGFGEASRQQKMEALTVMETDLAEDLDRREERIRTDDEGEEFLRRGRLEVLGAADRQPETLPERGGVEAKEHRAARYEALSEAGRELYTARLPALAPAGSRSGGPPGAVVDRALDETESDGRLQDLEAIFSDAEHRSYYRGLLVSAGDQVTLEQIDAALKVTEAFVHRKETIFEYPGNNEHPDGGALYAAAREALAPDWRPGVELAAGLLDQIIGRVEDQLADRVREAADIVEASVPTTQPWSHRPDYRVPAVSDELLDQLVQDDDNAFFKATVAELRKRYASRADYNTPDEKRYAGAARQDSQEKHLEVPSWSTVLARVLKGYLSRLREIVLAACDKILGGDLGERLARRRDQVERAADVAEAGLPRTQPGSYGPQVPAVSDETLEQVVTDKSTSFLKEVVAEVCDRYDRRGHAAYEERYDHEARRNSEGSHLNGAIENKHARAERLWLRSSRSPRPTRESVEASVVKDHRSTVLEVFEVACDEVVGRGELGAQLREHRAQVQQAAAAAEKTLPTTRPERYRPKYQVPAVSDVTLEHAAASKSDPFLQEVVAEVLARYDRRAGFDVDREERYDHEARRNSEGSHLNGAIENKHARAERLWLRSSRSPRPTRESVEASVVKDHRSTVLEVFEVACDEVVGRGELGAQLREHRAQVQQAAAAAEKTLPTTRPERYRPKYQVPAVSDVTLEHAAASKSDPFLQEVVAEVLARYDRRAGFDVDREERYDHEARRNSEGSHLNGAIENKHARAERLWLRSSRSPRPTRESVEASVVKDHRSTVLEVFEVACDEVVGRGELGAQLREHRAQVQQAAAAAEKTLPTTRPERYRPKYQVPAVSDVTLEHAAASKSDPFLQEVVAEVLARYDRRAGFDVDREERYDHEARRNSEGSHLNGVIENKHARAERLWLRSSRSPRPTRESVEASVVKDHRSTVLEVFEVACDEVVGRGELGAQLREHRAQVQRVVDAVEPSLPATQSYGRPGRHVPAVSDETLAEVRVGADAFLQKVVDLVWDRYDRCADYKTPSEERYDDDDRRQSEDTCLAELIAKTLEDQRESWLSSTQQAAVRARALKDHRSRIRGIFTSARDDVLRGDELRDRQQERSVRPSGAQRAGGVGTSAGRRAATEPPSESSSTSPGHERKPHGRGQQRGKQQERAGQDSTTGHGSKGRQGERPRAAAAPAPAPAVVSVTEADRVRLAVHAMAAKLPRTQPYDNPSHRPPALSDERFNRMAAATDDEFVRKVIAAVQEKGNYYTDFERTESEKSHLRPAVGKMYQDALDEYEKAKAKRWIFSKRPPKPTWTEAEAAVIKEFISEQLGVIKEICREVQQRTPAAVRSELQRFEPGQVVTPRPSKSRTRATNQQGRGDSGPSR